MNLAREIYTDMEDRPFGCPPDTVLDLPAPLSVNKTRKIDWASRPKFKAWRKTADDLLRIAWARGRKPPIIPGCFEAVIVLSESVSSIDIDNGIKSLLDYAKRIECIVDDSPKYLRRLVVEFGDVPEGCRLILRPCEGRPV